MKDIYIYIYMMEGDSSSSYISYIKGGGVNAITS